MRILICGSRGWHDEAPIKAVIAGHRGTSAVFTVIHGHCPDGADAIADHAGHDLGVHVVRVPADWERFHKAAGPIRNQKMLDEQKPDIVYAFRAHGKSSGTDDMVSKAVKAGVPTYVITQANPPEEEPLF